MTVTPADIATELGVAAPTTVQQAQWQAWIDRALYLIGKRLTIADLDAADVDYVVLQAVAAHARNPESSTQVDVAIDDGRVSKRYTSGPGGVIITDEWWELLDPSFAAESFSISVGGDTYWADARSVCATDPWFGC